jgi:hypothetical protein
VGYFSNSTENDIYQASYCEKCVHFSLDDECPVMFLHAIWNYDAVGRSADETKAAALENFIPTIAQPPGNGECRMFIQSNASIKHHWVPEDKET